MKLLYTYHSEHHASPRDRWLHFLLYLGALLLLFAAGQALYLYFTHWDGGTAQQPWWRLLLAIMYLAVGGALAYLAWRFEGTHPEDVCERYVHVDETTLSWHLEQRQGEERLPLDSIRSIERPNVRELHLGTDTGTVNLPIFLVVSEAKQAELLCVLEERTGAAV